MIVAINMNTKEHTLVRSASYIPHHNSPVILVVPDSYGFIHQGHFHKEPPVPGHELCQVKKAGWVSDWKPAHEHDWSEIRSYRPACIPII